jgi:two-component system sensor histidine kinase HydH
MRLVAEDFTAAGAKRTLTLRDLAWLLVFAVLALCQEHQDYSADVVLLFLAIFQVVEPKLRAFSSGRGKIASIFIKMALCYLLVGFAHGIDSDYYFIFLLPIVAAATELGLKGTIFFSVLACAAYASFLLFINWDLQYIPAAEWRILGLRLWFFPVVGLVVYEEAQGKRREMQRTKEAAEQLAESNRTLQLTQASLRRSERLAALGQLTAGLAHELRNPLGTIKASAELLARPTTREKHDVVEELSGYIASEVDRTNALVSRFLDFARPLEVHARTSDIRQAVEQAAAQAGARAESGQVRIQLRVPDQPLELSFDADLLSVAVLNLLQNAVDASPPESLVTLAVQDVGGQIRIAVSDHGAGIVREHLESIFNPFFTTKSNGTGLGLALVSKIVDEHRGRITVSSEPGRGTTFEILLPHDKQA